MEATYKATQDDALAKYNEGLKKLQRKCHYEMQPITERRLVYYSRKPTICPRCGKKEVRKAVLGYPREEDFYNDKIFLIGCIPDFPKNRDFGCRTVMLPSLKTLQEIEPH